MSAMLSLSGYDGIVIPPPPFKRISNFKISKSFAFFFLNAQKQCLIKIPFNLKLSVFKSSSKKKKVHLLLEQKV